MLGQGWQWQWARVQRRLEDVRAVYAGAPGGTDVALDMVQSFFEAVHHLRDWIINDPACVVIEDDVEELFKDNLVLRLCGDLANGSKHLKLTRRAWTGDKSTTIARNDAIVYVGEGTSAHRFYIASGGTEYDVRQIAEDAVDEWSTFLSGRGLI
ncbi:MAG: hypothetical protein WCD21_12940 [Streptomyces sp.]